MRYGYPYRTKEVGINGGTKQMGAEKPGAVHNKKQKIKEICHLHESASRNCTN